MSNNATWMDQSAMITATNKSSIVLIVDWLLLALSSFAILIRLVVKISRGIKHKGMMIDDYLLNSSFMFSAIQSILTGVRVNRGFGKISGELTLAQIHSAEKFELAANIFYILSVALANLSVLALISVLSPIGTHRLTAYAASGVIVAFAVASILVASFQCSVPLTWNYTEQKCINRPAWWTAFDSINLLFQLGLIIHPIYIFTEGKRTIPQKIVIAAPFALRIFAFGAFLADAILWQTQVAGAADPFFSEWTVAVTGQVVQSAGITCSCLLYFKTFLNSIESGSILGDINRLSLSTGKQLDDKLLQSTQDSTKGSNTFQPLQSADEEQAQVSQNLSSGQSTARETTEFSENNNGNSPGIYHNPLTGETLNVSRWL